MSFNQGVANAASGMAIGSAIGGIGGVVGGIGGLLSGLFADDSTDQGAALLAQNRALWSQLAIPELDKAIILNAYQQYGTLTPELIQKLNLSADTKQMLQEDPSNKQNEQASLNTLKQLSQTGMSPQDIAQMQDMRSKVAQDTNAKTNQILQQSQMRGQLGSGDTLAAQLMANQQGSQTAAKGAIDAGAQAAQARREALNNYSNLASRVRGEDFNTANINNQNDIERKRFLDQNSLSRQTANVGAQNKANAYNLERQQAVGDSNVKAQNDELARQMKAKETMFDMQVRKLNGMTGANVASGNYAQSQAANQAAADSKTVAGLPALIGGFKNVWGNATKETPTTTPYKNPQDQVPILYKGGRVPGSPPIPGEDTPANDIVKAVVSPKEIVVPVSHSHDPKKAKEFIDNLFRQEAPPSKKDKHAERNDAILSLIADLHRKKSKE